ncbi:MAG: DUF4113 domain-containing protein [Marinilabiliaceae bacterium]
MLYGLMDCNNFFVSCERVFRPDLEGKPVVVLSNNDGCVVSRSNEAKEMGIPMGLPYFRIGEYDPFGKVTAFSSNYVLYADLSRRVMSILADNVGETMPYSIDECFFTIAKDANEAEAACRGIPAQIRQWTGIPVSMGLAPTKTLAKVACRFAKKFKGYGGFCSITDELKRDKAASLISIDSVWGIGRRSVKKLNSAGIYTAADFCKATEAQIQRLMGINGVRVRNELLGVDSVMNEDTDTGKKSICTSRSFASMVTSIEEMRPIIANFASMAAARLRAQNSVANIVSVFVASNVFRDDLKQYSNITNMVLPEAVDNQIEIVRAADAGLVSIFRKGVAYKRAGVILSGISSAKAVQMSIFYQRPANAEKMSKISKVVDALNTSGGANLVHLASQMSERPTNLSQGAANGQKSKDNPFLSNLRRDHISNRYTTDWNEIIKLH